VLDFKRQRQYLSIDLGQEADVTNGFGGLVDAGEKEALRRLHLQFAAFNRSVESRVNH